MKYTTRTRQKRWPRRLTIVFLVTLAVTVGATLYARQVYYKNLEPVSSIQTTKLIVVKEGASLEEIAQQLQDAELIRSAWAFKLYVSSKQARSNLQAGTYALAPSLSTQEIVIKLSSGNIAVDTVTILPGQRVDQIRAALINDGFSPNEVDAALNPATYATNPALVDKPESANLEGYLFPDSFQKTSTTTASSVVERSLAGMQNALTPQLRAAFAQQGLSTYQAIILASIVEKEVSNAEDQAQVAQVFLSRLRQDISLGSDPTAFYGAVMAGKEPSVNYDSPYNTRLHKGLPPTPISNVGLSSLNAVAHPADTDWLFFVSGDDGTTHFSKTLEEHEALTKQYCHKLCE
jgi:UPF0755 protein